MSAPRIVHVIDDDPAVRDSIQRLLTTEGFDARTYDSADAFLAAIGAGGAGCVVTDVRMPGISGIELLSKLEERDLALPVVVITAHADVPLAVTAMKRGAADLIEKPFGADDLVASVRAAMDLGGGERGSAPHEIQRRLSTLSARENQVLAGLLAGRPNKIIAYEMGISPRTVEVHRANVMRKTQARSLSELVRLSLIAGKGETLSP